MIFRTFALTFVATLLGLVHSRSCAVFDCVWGLYVFGETANYAIGPQSGWSANPLPAYPTTPEGRPPFNGENTQCFLSQYYNSMYVLDGDKSAPNAVHIFNFATQTWSTLQTNLNGVDPSKLQAILDRNTNVFFALSNNKLYSLDMGALKDADSNTHDWAAVGDAPFAQNNAYPSPVMALADNHIHFLNTGVPGQANIFVIHFAYFQPEIQKYNAIESDGQSFPSTPGKAVSFFKDENTPQQKFAFIPDDGRATYVVDVLSNTTQTIPGPSVKSANSVYAASQQQLVQLDISTGELYWLPFSPDDVGPNYSATWTKLPLSIPAMPTSNSTTTSGTRTATSSSPANTSGGAAASRVNLLTSSLGLVFGLVGAWSLL